jgi:hypothetical protein
MTSRTEGVRVEGARELRSTLKRAGENLNDLKAAHSEAAQLVTAASRPRSPRRTGALAGTVRGSGTTTAAVIRAGGARVPYAGPIHFGWPGHNIEAHPFISEAAESTEPAWTRLYVNEVEKILEKVHGI